ncbi:MAG: hypothetical protein J0H02_13030 [Armatimonadetes bacterium]|nr:hypothetical protein [Armatimonadota bacterium]
MIKKLIALSLLCVVVSCSGGSSSNTPGYEPKDFQKSGPPPEYKGPGQPGGPASGPVGGK